MMSHGTALHFYVGMSVKDHVARVDMVSYVG